jgi:hypothetical protein
MESMFSSLDRDRDAPGRVHRHGDSGSSVVYHYDHGMATGPGMMQLNMVTMTGRAGPRSES